jgi:hypothetical protein
MWCVPPKPMELVAPSDPLVVPGAGLPRGLFCATLELQIREADQMWLWRQPYKEGNDAY